MPRIVYLSWPSHEITGGIKMHYRHVETLCQAGFEACVATPDAKPPNWFETTATVLSLNDLTPGSDVLVFPENHAGFLRQFAAWPNRKVVFCQNQFMVWRGLENAGDYADFGVHDLICPAELVAAFCRRRCPKQRIHVVSNGIDEQLFHPRPPKRLQIVYAPRKRPSEAAFIRDLFQADNPSWAAIPWQPLDQISEREVARILGESALYLSLCRFEALSLSALEALASGCVIAGFTGFGGRDYATSGNGFWAVEEDCLDAVQQLTLATRLVMEGGDRHRRMVENAQRTAAVYSQDHFARQLIECWQNLLREPLATISVITPVFNAGQFLARAVASVRRQTFTAWELLLVDDASTDDSFTLMTQLAQDDPRIRTLRRSRNGGPSAARNEALRQVRGEIIVYLDQDDEFYPDYLEHVARYRERGDVLVFAYDLIEERPDHPAYGTVSSWNPRQVLHQLPQKNIAVPLGVAHRRDLLDRVGLFDDRVLIEQDWDLWKRFASAGATFAYLPHRSGLYHIRSDSLARTRIDTPPLALLPRRPRILFSSYHCYLDPSSGAALATRDLLELLSHRGWSCGVLCGPLLDFEGGGALPQILADERLSVEQRAGPEGEGSSSLYHFRREGVPVTIYAPDGPPHPAGPKEGDAFLQLFEEMVEQFRPDVLLSYGGTWPTPALFDRARRRGLAVVFALHNFAYNDAALFRDMDAVLVPSRGFPPSITSAR